MLRSRPSARQPGTGTLRSRLQGRAFALLYGPAARFYDRFTAWLFLGEWARWQQAALPHLPANGPILELGSGTGALGARLETSGIRWIGVERSPAMTRTAARRLGYGGEGGHRPRAPGPPRPVGADQCVRPCSGLLRADAARLPLPARSVAGVVATFPTRFILDPRVAAEARRVLVPGGPLVIVLSGELRPHGPRRRARRLALRAFYGPRRATGSDGFSVDGFDGAVERVPTRHGEATVYVGRPRGDPGQRPRRL
jgi:SAM-dependent methyltransferase